MSSDGLLASWYCAGLEAGGVGWTALVSPLWTAGDGLAACGMNRMKTDGHIWSLVKMAVSVVGTCTCAVHV